METFAVGKAIRELPRLCKLYGKGRWRIGMRSRRTKTQGFAVCIRNAGFGASLEVRKLYPLVDDPDAEADDLIRVIDESGEDYVYPARLFRRALRLAS